VILHNIIHFIAKQIGGSTIGNNRLDNVWNVDDIIAVVLDADASCVYGKKI
jgi:hypothetical protein